METKLYTLKQIADELGVTKDTIKYRVKQIPPSEVKRQNDIKYITEQGYSLIKELIGNYRQPNAYLVTDEETGAESIIDKLNNPRKHTEHPEEAENTPFPQGNTGESEVFPGVHIEPIGNYPIKNPEENAGNGNSQLAVQNTAQLEMIQALTQQLAVKDEQIAMLSELLKQAMNNQNTTKEAATEQPSPASAPTPTPTQEKQGFFSRIFGKKNK